MEASSPSVASRTGRPSSYVHEPLPDAANYIRLLQIKRESFSERHGPISCELRTFDLEACPSYQALSYMWGPESPVLKILIDGRPFIVRRNLRDFLKAARRNVWVAGWIWIDQISIDQANIPERNTQVQNMWRIFSGAEQVCIWLGDHGKLGDTMITAVVNEVDRARTRVARNNKIATHPYQIADAIFDAVEKSHGLLPVRPEMLYNPYWSRLWAAQEICLSQTITISCSNSRLEWDYVQDSQELFSYGKDALDCVTILYWRLDNGKYRGEDSRRSYRLMDSTELVSRAKCSDPRDHIYGVMGITLPEQRVRVDYSMSVMEVFLAYLHKFYVAESKRLLDEDDMFWLILLACKMGLLGERYSRTRDSQVPRYFRRQNTPDDFSLPRILVELFIRYPGRDLQPLELPQRYEDSAYSCITGTIGKQWFCDGRPLEDHVMRHDLQLPELKERLRLYQKIMDSRRSWLQEDDEF